MNHNTSIYHNGQKTPSQLFFEAKRDGWNLEMDWLWLASKLENDIERAYCYESVLYINPKSVIAKQELQSLRAKEQQLEQGRLPARKTQLGILAQVCSGIVTR